MAAKKKHKLLLLLLFLMKNYNKNIKLFLNLAKTEIKINAQAIQTIVIPMI